MKFRILIAAVLGLSLLSNESMAVRIDTGGKSEAELSSEMVRRCQHQMGEFGNQGVQVCIDSEREAMDALAAYADDVEDIANRCYRFMRKNGWYLVKRCTDDNVAAKEALQAYSVEHESVVEACEAEFGRRNYEMVKRCADDQIGNSSADG